MIGEVFEIEEGVQFEGKNLIDFLGNKEFDLGVLEGKLFLDDERLVDGGFVVGDEQLNELDEGGDD